MEVTVPNPLFMLEYLDRIGVNVKQFVDEQSIKNEYLRRIYRLDARDKMIDKTGKPVGKATNPRHLLH